MNKPKIKGTRWETLVARYLSEVMGTRVERRALHGGQDMGDLGPFRARGLEVIAECKNYASFGQADVERWRRETDRERAAANADVALLVVNQGRIGEKTVGLARVDVRLDQLALMAALAPGHEPPDALDVSVWVSISLADAVSIMGGSPGRWGA